MTHILNRQVLDLTDPQDAFAVYVYPEDTAIVAGLDMDNFCPVNIHEIIFGWFQVWSW